MGAKDIKSKEYLADNTRFADLFNYKLYNGEQIILPEDLQERDSTEVLSVLGLDEKEIQTQKWRDLLKSAVIKSTENAFYVLLGVENQTDVHYAMPVRNMIYDALNYGKQVNEAKKRHETNKENMSSAEFLSGFKKGDKLTPIIPITLYWGTDEWDAPTHLHEMFGEIDENLLQYIPDYHINLVAPNLIEDFDKFKTELKQIFEFIKYSNDKDHFKEMLSKLKDMKLTNETVSTINLFTGSDIKLNEEEEVTDVCRAIEEIKKEAAEEAVAEMCIAIEEIKKEAAEEAVAEMCIAIEEIKKEAAEEAVAEMCIAIEEIKKEAAEEAVAEMCIAIEEIKKEAAEEAVAEMCIAIEEIKKEAAEEAVAEMCIAIEEIKKEAAEEAVAEMCIAIEEIKKEAAEEAVAEMCIAIEEIKKEAAEEVAKIKIANVENIMESIHVSVEEACRMLKYSVKDYENAKKKFAI